MLSTYTCKKKEKEEEETRTSQISKSLRLNMLSDLVTLKQVWWHAARNSAVRRVKKGHKFLPGLGHIQNPTSKPKTKGRENRGNPKH